MICDWASTALENAISVTTTRLKDIYDETTKTFNYTYGKRKLREEFLRARELDLEFSIIVMKIDNYPDVPEDSRNELLKTVGNILRHTFRSGDIITRYSTEDSFMTILPGATIQGSQIAQKRLKDEMAKIPLKPFKDQTPLTLLMGDAVFKPTQESENDMLKQAESGLLKR
jgi:diguanylate cyclase (GGDEF)-like protein